MIMFGFFLIFFGLFNIFVVVQFIEYNRRINTLESYCIRHIGKELEEIISETLAKQ